MTSILDRLTSRADQQARQQHEHRQQERRTREGEGTPQVSLAAAYAGTIDPADIPRDSVTEYDPAKPSKISEEQQRANVDAMLQLARQGVL